MADNEALRFENENDNEATRIGLASLCELQVELVMEIKLDNQYAAIEKLKNITNTNNRANELEALRTLVYVRSKGHIYIDLRDDTRASTPQHERRWGMFYCILCRTGLMYGRCDLYRHIMGNTHLENVEVARFTLLSPGAFPYNDGIELFQYDPLNIEEGLDVGTHLCPLPDCCARDVNDVPARFPSYRRAILISGQDLRAVFDWCLTITATVSTTNPQNISSILCSSELNSVRVIGTEAEYTEYSVLTLNRTANLDQECGLCTHLMKGPHVSTLVSTRTPEFPDDTLVCSQLHFHIFHTSCLIKWILWREYSFLRRHKPEVRNIHRHLKSPVPCMSCLPVGSVPRPRINHAHRNWQTRMVAVADHEVLANSSIGLWFLHPDEPQQVLPVKLVRCYRAGDNWH